jgi:hypothetical protein
VSIQGTLGPLVQGPAASRSGRTKVVTLFVVAFFTGAVATFAAVNAMGMALGSTSLPFRWRIAIASAGLLPLAAVDVAAIAKSTYCPIGWRRQTPRILLRRHTVAAVASIWGLDTGLVVTTFRVAAVSWGALAFGALGLSPQWTGLGYGLGFALPFLILVCRPHLGRASRLAVSADPGLEALLRKRAAIQGLSAASLVTSSSILIASLIGQPR